MSADSTMSKTRLVMVACIWLAVLGCGVATYRWWFKPRADKQLAAKAEEEKKQLLHTTSSDAHFKQQITINLDSFSGYAPLRSEAFRSNLGAKGIGLNLVDDEADYNRRLQDLRDGKCQMAAFTVDALIKASAKLNDIPATIIFVLDESRDADAMVGVSRTLPNVDALNDPETKFVVVPDSPSETLSRVVMSAFNLNRLEKNPWIYAKSAREVYELYRKHQPNDKKIFVLWEPYVSKMVQNPDYKVVVGSGKFKGYILDVMVVSRDFLAKNPQIVQDVTECYFRSLYLSSLADLVLEDSVRQGEPLKKAEAETLVQKVWFKNTRENYAHFGLQKTAGFQHIEETITNLTRVLLKTGAISADPTNTQANLFYYDRILREMQKTNFHPGDEKMREESDLIALSEDDWKRLEPVGTLEVPKLIFARGTSNLTWTSNDALLELAIKLKSFPRYYLLIRGDASQIGNLEDNKVLALQRAKAAKDFLISAGISSTRMQATAGMPSGETSVSFVLGQLPY